MRWVWPFVPAVSACLLLVGAVGSHLREPACPVAVAAGEAAWETPRRVEVTRRYRSGAERSWSLDLRREGGRWEAEVVEPRNQAGLRVVVGATDPAIFLPAADRWVNVTGAGRTGAVLGSDLSYDDLVILDRLLPLGTGAGDRPHGTGSRGPAASYTDVRVAVRRSDSSVERIGFHDEGGQAKRIEVSPVGPDGRIELEVRDLRRGSATHVVVRPAAGG